MPATKTEDQSPVTMPATKTEDQSPETMPATTTEDKSAGTMLATTIEDKSTGKTPVTTIEDKSYVVLSSDTARCSYCFQRALIACAVCRLPYCYATQCMATDEPIHKQVCESYAQSKSLERSKYKFRALLFENHQLKWTYIWSPEKKSWKSLNHWFANRSFTFETLCGNQLQVPSSAYHNRHKLRLYKLKDEVVELSKAELNEPLKSLTLGRWKSEVRGPAIMVATIVDSQTKEEELHDVDISDVRFLVDSFCMKGITFASLMSPRRPGRFAKP